MVHDNTQGRVLHHLEHVRDPGDAVNERRQVRFFCLGDRLDVLRTVGDLPQDSDVGHPFMQHVKCAEQIVVVLTKVIIDGAHIDAHDTLVLRIQFVHPGENRVIDWCRSVCIGVRQCVGDKARTDKEHGLVVRVRCVDIQARYTECQRRNLLRQHARGRRHNRVIQRIRRR